MWINRGMAIVVVAHNMSDIYGLSRAGNLIKLARFIPKDRHRDAPGEAWISLQIHVTKEGKPEEVVAGCAA